MNDPIKFLQRLSIAGGSIVSTGSLTSAEIATAFNDGRMFVDQDHLGYVFIPEGDLRARIAGEAVSKILSHLKAKGRGFITPNELRLAADLPPVPGEDAISDFQSL